jgi:hypothetical protein
VQPTPSTAIDDSNQWASEWWREFGQAYSGERIDLQSGEPYGYEDVTLQTVEFAGDQAVARVILNANKGQAYRQTRFFRHTSVGWLRTERDADLWGPERSLATPYFVYHFRQNDAPVVMTVASQMDALHTTLWRNFGLPIRPTPTKLIIEVSVTHSAGQAASRLDGSERFLVPAPAVYLAPVELTDAELLAQSLALPLTEHVLAQAREYHAIGHHWQPLLDGLRLWQVWDLDLPLAVWREPIVQWLYVDLPSSIPGQSIALPERYTALCAAHRLWLVSPMQLHIPLLCAEREGEAWHSSPWADPLRRLDQNLVPVHPGDAHWNSRHELNHPSQAVALATLIDYAVATYGRDRLPVLVAGLGQYESWATLIPAVYGVSPAEFEAGWQAYLAAHYGVPLRSPFAH